MSHCCANPTTGVIRRRRDAFYMPPGHVPSAIAGTDFVMFSPKDQLAVTDAAIAANVAKMMGTAN